VIVGRRPAFAVGAILATTGSTARATLSTLTRTTRKRARTIPVRVTMPDRVAP
jgi:hypothetical protein